MNSEKTISRLRKLSPEKRELLARRVREALSDRDGDPALHARDSLAAYVVATSGSHPTAEELRRELERTLPDYMVPSSVTFLDALPELPSGKVDRRALPSPHRGPAESRQDYVAPRTALEETVANAFAEVLPGGRVGADSDFFRSGGHSLLATQVVFRLREALQVDLSLGALFHNPTVAGLAREIAERTGRQSIVPPFPVIVPAPDDRYVPFPLNDVQEAYWVGRSDSVELGNVATHVYWEVDCLDLDLRRFGEAWRRLIDRHDALRTVITPDGQQRVLDRVPPYEIELLDLSRHALEAAGSALETVRERMSHQVRASDRWPLFEIRASRLDETRIRLHFSFDALTLDAWSIAVPLFREWSRLYENPRAALSPLSLSFRDYVLAERALKDSELYERSREYWTKRRSTLPPAPELPLARAPSTITHPQFSCRTERLSPDVWTRLKRRANRAGLTPSGVLLAAYAEVLKVWSRRPRFTLNLTLFNRLPLHPEVESVVGDFTSLVLLEVDHRTDAPFEARARRLQEQLWQDLDHRHFSGVQVLRLLAKQEGGVPRALMPVVFTSVLTHHTESDDKSSMDWVGEIVYRISQTPQVWLDHGVIEEDGALRFMWSAVEELFPEGLLQEMFDRYCDLLRDLANDEASWKERWPETVRRLTAPLDIASRDPAPPDTAPPSGELLHTLFETRASLLPDQLAVVAANGSLTYRELSWRANHLARRLRESGARPDTLVAVVMEKGWEQVAGVLGILTAGAAYLPIDAGLPTERIRHLLETGEVTVVVTQSWIDEGLAWPEGLRRIRVDEEEPAETTRRPIESVQNPEDLAYVIFTSGSTGEPKGVMIDHRGAVNTVLDINERFGVRPNDRVLAVSSLTFDLSVYDIFGTLAAGATIVVPDASGTRDPAHWRELLDQERITIWNSVPALTSLLVEYVEDRGCFLPSCLRLVMMSGDWIPVTLPDRMRALIEGVQVISLGGATEASIWSILYPIGEVDPLWRSIPYGRAMARQGVHVLNEALERCPTWVEGEIYISGIGLAKGYWRDELKTSSSFLLHPVDGERLYRTGDIGRYLPSGDIEFLGREDSQVKIQGNRIELGEIEATLLQHPDVRAAAVAAKDSPSGDRRLAAYVMTNGTSRPSAGELRRFLQQKLPGYMVPPSYTFLSELPRTSNGKIDRRALPDASERGDPGDAGSPRERERREAARIRSLVATVLQLGGVDSRADLLDLGATSVDMIRIVNRVDAELGFRPRLDAFYRQPTVEGLVGLWDEQRREGAHPTDVALHDVPSGADPVLLDPEERQTFKDAQPGLRRECAARASIQLPETGTDRERRNTFASRRSHRRFAAGPIALRGFSALLGCLRQVRLDGRPKYRYASAGGMYAVQTYLSVKPERVDGLNPGIYYYHPVDHRLVRLSPCDDDEREIHDRLVNRPVFEEAGFSVFLIAQLDAIRPMYGERSLHLATIEAGLMAQLLEMSGPDHGIGLCQIGGVEFERVRHLFGLNEGHVLVHSLLGGAIDSRSEEPSTSSHDGGRGENSASTEGAVEWEEGEV